MRTASFSLGALLASTTLAGAAVFDLSNPTGPDLGASHIYSAGGVSITAYAEGGDLTAKSVLPDDIGLGLTSSPFHDGEITPGNWIAFDMFLVSGDITFVPSSTAGGDVFHLYESSSRTSLGTSLYAGTGDNPVDIGPLSEPYLIVTADAGPTGNGTILAHLIEAELTVPEPANSAGMLGIALAFLGLTMLRPKARA